VRASFAVFASLGNAIIADITIRLMEPLNFKRVLNNLA
jgi:hypothetical protein